MAGRKAFPPEIRTEPDRDPDALPDSTDPSGPCTRCERISNFSLIGTLPVTFRKDGSYAVLPGGNAERLFEEQVAILECNGCRDRVVVIEQQLTGGVPGGPSGTVTHRGFNWWPAPGASGLGPDVPDRVAEAYAESMRCLSAGAPNAAVAMLRTVLTYIVEDRASASARDKPDLKEKVKAVVAEGGLPTSLGEWATHVRLYGNAGAHPDLFGDVGMDEAKDVSRLARTLIEVVYELPSAIARRQAERTRPEA